jgi:acyl-coenzyme A synthetase/AMP-(fatty) acid ligase
MRILGRESELINVGGQKVYPAEVEDVLLGSADVADAVVYGERHPIMGSIVCADVRLREPGTDDGEARRRLKQYCASRLDAFKVPVKIKITGSAIHGDRMKRIRRAREGES